MLGTSSESTEEGGNPSTGSLRVVGAGLPRTGTASMKEALERLLGGPCYHMREVFEHPEHSALWSRALHGDAAGWRACLQGYVAAVDWPASFFWREIADANPDAPVLLTVRTDARAWWGSVDATIMAVLRREALQHDPAWAAMAIELFERTGIRDGDPDGTMALYERHNAEVRAAVPPERLIEWRPGDGWEPICTGLGIPVPDEPYPHVNTREEWLERRVQEAEQSPGS
jgi:hypothetical protein